MVRGLNIKIKRVYGEPAETDGCRVLVDRLWPRGLSKQKAKVDIWVKEIAPSHELRKWFGHDPSKWGEFKIRYKRELNGKEGLIQSLIDKASRGVITLLFSASDEQHNNAVVLRDVLEGRAASRGQIAEYSNLPN